MTKYKPGESKFERRLRRIREHNEKMITEHFHLDLEGHLKQKIKRMGEDYRSITAKFTDKEVEEASEICFMIGNLIKPEDGMTYEEVACLLGWSEEWLEDDSYVSRINRLLYVLQMITFEFLFNTTIESGEEKDGDRRLTIIPHVKETKKIRVSAPNFRGDPSYRTEYEGCNKQVIFNAAASREYSVEAFEKLGIGFGYKLKKDDFQKVGIPFDCVATEQEKEFVEMFDNLKGIKSRINGRDRYNYIDELTPLIKKIGNRFCKGLGPNGIEEDDLMHEIMPELVGRVGNDLNLELYETKFTDALYIIYYRFDKDGDLPEGIFEEWKKDHGYG
jgi:hypothetical protein